MIGVLKLENIGRPTLVDEWHSQMITQFTTLNLTLRALKNEIIRSIRQFVFETAKERLYPKCIDA
jgi:hypothetical protein